MPLCCPTATAQAFSETWTDPVVIKDGESLEPVVRCGGEGDGVRGMAWSTSC
jgi:RNA polymerase subunit RPABC4/transcription elongation factor Spt4